MTDVIHPSARADAAAQTCDLDALLDVESRFRAVFDHAPIGQIFSTMDGLVESVNRPMAAMLGYEPAQMVGRPVREFAEPTEYERIRETTTSLMTGEVLSASDIRRFRHRDGRQVPVRVTSALLRDEAGRPAWWVSMVVDITEDERTQTELALAHEAALVAADRLRVTHLIAASANEATRLHDLAPVLLASVCDHFAWPAAALVRWVGAGPEVLASHGDTIAPAMLPAALEPADGDADVVQHDTGLVLVPLKGTRTGRLAWVFRAGCIDLDHGAREVLTVVAIETARVIERDRAASLLRDSEARFRSVFDSSPLPMGLTIGESGTFSAVNSALCHLVGRSPDELLGLSARDICHPDDAALTDPAGAAAAESPDGRHRFDLRLLHTSGRVVIAMITLAWMDGPDGSRQLLAQMEDVTAQRTVEDVLRRQAEEDSLTGLANRAHLNRVLLELSHQELSCAVLFIDLDGFKVINDTRGHDVGDDVLLAAAARLRTAVRPGDLVARFGGDEFVVLSPAGQADPRALARRIADRIDAALSEPIDTAQGPVVITASIGIAYGPVDRDAPHALLQRADAAMYHAKRRGKDRHEEYDTQLHQRAVEYRRTEAAVRNALAEDRFVVHYQPIVRLSDHAVLGFEALVRLIDESGSIVGPDRFIEVAEESGLIVPMGAWVLGESCRMIADLRRTTGRPLTVSVNIAARQAARPDLAATVLRALESADLPEDALSLELTESALLEADQATLAQLVELRDRGVGIGLDDFGTGYSSLTYLRRFPISHLKVDRSFVAGMTTAASDHAIVRAVTRLADDLGMTWIAEGIETAQQLDELTALGDGIGQGYLFSRPVPADQLPALLGVPTEPARRRARATRVAAVRHPDRRFVGMRDDRG
ncbi:MAG TPA: EAL domain-containing protein [Jatrophihabitans sp.]|uniref:sensor domain-containing protein n=1 Tax=Jatrophihabitans sp. TaxID=1932789 RepID=UPI002E0853C6|nr:EAL domain-containing protein [Jatrophihabitans sp.]